MQQHQRDSSSSNGDFVGGGDLHQRHPPLPPPPPHHLPPPPPHPHLTPFLSHLHHHHHGGHHPHPHPHDLFRSPVTEAGFSHQSLEALRLKSEVAAAAAAAAAAASAGIKIPLGSPTSPFGGGTRDKGRTLLRGGFWKERETLCAPCGS